MANIVAYILAMKVANIGELKNNLSKFIGFVENGELCKYENITYRLQNWFPLNQRKPAIIPGLDVVREPLRSKLI
jgi:hypothetical protein